jgi:predicted transcriptional regulator
MRRIEIGVVSPKEESQALLDWAARVDAGEEMLEAEPRLSFATYSQLHAALTDKRMGLLEQLAQNDGTNIRQLAALLNRDYKNVYDDVQILSKIGLVEKRDGLLYVPYDDITIHKSLRRAA